MDHGAGPRGVGCDPRGQQGLSELVGRLILATVGPEAKLRFPTGDSVQFSGWDGVCTTAVGAGHVPRRLGVGVHRPAGRHRRRGK